MDLGQVGHLVRRSVVLERSNVIVHVFHPVPIVEIIHMNKERVVKPIVNVWQVRSHPSNGEKRLPDNEKCVFFSGIKQTEPTKYPMKGYLSIREGDILCVPQNSSAMGKYMADLVSSIDDINSIYIRSFSCSTKICKSIGLNRGAEYGKYLSIFASSFMDLCFEMLF